MVSLEFTELAFNKRKLKTIKKNKLNTKNYLKTKHN